MIAIQGWNPVLNKFKEIKNEYKRVFGTISYDYISSYTNKSESCLERWVRELNVTEPINSYTEFDDLISCLEINQYKNMLLIRYGRYSNVYDGETEASGEDFWKRYNGFYRECRSVVIDVENECLILTPFAKFFNVNELDETSVDTIQKRIREAVVVEFSDKLDGSMQSARWYNEQIIMSGSQSLNPDASWRLKDGYKMINSLKGYEEMLRSYPYYTFIFEYISLKDAHVVKYSKSQEGLYLIGVRDVDTGKEFTYNMVLKFAKRFGIPSTRVFKKTLSQVMTELDDKSSDEAEGFVINVDGYKVKCKYNDYVYVHKALLKLSSINLTIRSIADDKYDDLLSKLPEAYHEPVKRIAKVVVSYIRETEEAIKKYYDKAPKSNRKEFMIYVAENVPKEYSGYCKAKYLGKKINVLKSGNDKCPKYKKLKDMGIVNYTELFSEDDGGDYE